jgi:serine/threonine-protein kinase RsbW
MLAPSSENLHPFLMHSLHNHQCKSIIDIVCTTGTTGRHYREKPSRSMTTSGSAFCTSSHYFIAPGYAGRRAVALRGRARQRVFPGQPEHVADVRRFVLEALVGSNHADDAALLSSELATNAIRHTASGGESGTFQVTAFWHSGAIIIAVTDRGAATIPALHSPDSLDSAGRGLSLVDAIARQWGFHGSRHGRTVWFELGPTPFPYASPPSTSYRPHP